MPFALPLLQIQAGKNVKVKGGNDQEMAQSETWVHGIIHVDDIIYLKRNLHWRFLVHDLHEYNIFKAIFNVPVQ